MDSLPSKEMSEMHPYAGIFIILVVGLGVLLWFSPLRFRKRDFKTETLTPWDIRWFDFGIWLAGLYCVVFGFQALFFSIIPEMSESPLPWELNEGNRTWSILVAALTLQIPMVGYFFILRTCRPELCRYPLNTGKASILPILLKSLLYFLLVMPLVLAISILWNLLLSGLHSLGIPVNREPQELVDIIASNASPAFFLIFFFLAVVLAPIAEELVFRGGIYRFLKSRCPRIAALLISALLFALLHGNLVSFGPLLFLGVALAVAYETTGDIRTPIFLHALFNAYQLFMILLMGQPIT